MTTVKTPEVFQQNHKDKMNARPHTTTTRFVDKFPQIQVEHRIIFDTLCAFEVMKIDSFTPDVVPGSPYELYVAQLQGAKQVAHKFGYPFEFIQYFLERFCRERRGSVLSAMDFERYLSKGVVEFDTYEEYLVKNVKN